MKQIYTLLAGVLTATSAFALNVDMTTSEKLINPNRARISSTAINSSVRKAPMKEVTSEMPADFWGFNCDIWSWYTLSNQAVKSLTIATEFNSDLTDALDGKKISSIGVISPVLSTPKTDMTLFLTYDLDAEPVVELKLTTTGTPLTPDGYIESINYDYSKLDKSITIEKGKPFYVGVKYTDLAQGCYPIPVDGVPYNGTGLLVKSEITGNQWTNLTSSYGAGCFYIGLDEAPKNMMRMLGMTLSKQAVPGGTLKGEATLFNIGSNDITSAGFNFEIGEQKPYYLEVNNENGSLLTQEGYNLVPKPVAPRSYGFASIDNVPVEEIGILPVKASLTSVNKSDDLWKGDFAQSTILVLPEGSGYKRNVVVEEGTGTWCGWCIRGYVGMEYMAEKYKDDPSYIGIAVHAGDEMEAESYGPMIERYFSGFPSAVVNRSADIDPSADELEEAYKDALELPTYGKIELSIDGVEGKTAKVSSKSEFSLDANCAVAYAIKEDGVGPYSQANYYSGGANGAMGGFESKPEKVRLTFNEVARDIKDAFGIEGSLPEKLEEGKVYEHSTSLSLNNVKDPQKATVVAMIINQEDGTIVNAAQCKIADTAVKGIYDNGSDTRIFAANGVISLNGASAAGVYTPDGVRVASIAANGSANVAPGIYIVRTANKAVKVIVK